MKIICKIADADCPKGLRICCGMCDHKDGCDMVCTSLKEIDILKCPDASISAGVIAFESAVPEAIEKITTIMQMQKELDEQAKAMKKALLAAMEEYGVKSFKNDVISLTYVAPTTKTIVDTTRLREDHPDLVEQYSKTSKVSASVRITVK